MTPSRGRNAGFEGDYQADTDRIANQGGSDAIFRLFTDCVVPTGLLNSLVA